MTHSLNILLVSRRKEILDQLERMLEASGLSPRRQLNSNGHVDPLHGVADVPDLMVLHLSHLWREELEAIAARPPELRPALIVVGAASDMNLMRLAMQAGARDLLPHPFVEQDLLQAIERTLEDRPRAIKSATPGQISVFMNAKGG
jgi:pilus assembly protein CpaE